MRCLKFLTLLAMSAFTLEGCSGQNFDSLVDQSLLPHTATPTNPPLADGHFDRAYLDNSIIDVSATTLTAGTSVDLTLSVRDENGDPVDTGPLAIFFYFSGGTSAGKVLRAVRGDGGIYTASLKGQVSGSPSRVTASVNGNFLNTASPLVQVLSGDPDPSLSTVSTASATVSLGSSVVITVFSRDSFGNLCSQGGSTVTFTNVGGTSHGSFGTVADLGNGLYTTTFTGTAIGTATKIKAKIGGVDLPGPFPTVQVQ